MLEKSTCNLGLSYVVLLTHLFPMHPSSTPRKHQKTFSFLMFSGDRERVHWKNWVKLALFFQADVFLRAFMYLLLLCYSVRVTMMEIFILTNLLICRRTRNAYCLENLSVFQSVDIP